MTGVELQGHSSRTKIVMETVGDETIPSKQQVKRPIHTYKYNIYMYMTVNLIHSTITY